MAAIRLARAYKREGNCSKISVVEICMLSFLSAITEFEVG